jgi:hypothetical protein
MDKNTGVPHLRHRASLVTGQYKGRTVIDVAAKIAKKAKKNKSAKSKQKPLEAVFVLANKLFTQLVLVFLSLFFNIFYTV